MSDEIKNYRVEYFCRVPLGTKFQTHLGGDVFIKTRKGGTEFDDGGRYNIGPWLHVLVDFEKAWTELDRHTFEFTDKQRDDVIEEIIKRAVERHNVRQPDRLRKGLLCAHREHPIRLIDLLKSCNTDFPTDVILGVYKHYDPATDTIKDGWVAQHSQPHTLSLLEQILGVEFGE